MTTLSEMKTLAEGYIREGYIHPSKAFAIIEEVPQAIEVIEKMADVLNTAQTMLPHDGKLNSMACAFSISEALAEYRKLEGK